MRVGIVGWFGSDNLGDEILLHALMDCVRSAVPDASIVVFSPTPRRVTELHQVSAQPMPTIRARGSAGRQAVVQAEIRRCDILILGPGTVFQERSPHLRWPGSLVLFSRIVGMAKIAKTPVAVVGAGVREGVTPLGHRMLRILGSACVAVGTRDVRSAAHFGEGAQVIGDLAYALELPATIAPDRGRRFAVSARPLAPQVERSLLGALGDCVQRLSDDGWSGEFLPMALGRDAKGEDDRDLYPRAFQGTLGLTVNPLERPGPLAETLGPWLNRLAGYQLVLATRLHAAVMAVRLGVPTVAIAYERKVGEVFADAKLDRFLVAPDASAGTLQEVAENAVAAAEEFREAAARMAVQGAVGRDFVASVLGGVL